MQLSNVEKKKKSEIDDKLELESGGSSIYAENVVEMYIG